jgi:ABC transporter with metal-binding/Fe-S-binding domain ATP-binding protein
MVSKTRVAVLASGGKDSTLALYRALKDGYDVTCLATMVPLREDSWMFHYPNIGLVDLFSEAVGIPLVKAETQGVKEQEVDDLKRFIEKLGVEGVVSGGIASNYQKTKIDKVCRQLNLQSIAPLWGKDPTDLLDEMLALEFDMIIVGVYAYGFSEEWLGRKIDARAVDDLRRLNKSYGVSMVGEGGEYETLVLDATFFKKRIKILSGRKVWKGQSGQYLVSEARVESK